MILIKKLKNYKMSFNFFSQGEKMKESKYLYDSWFDDLYEDLDWEHTCEEQGNHDKAVDLVKSLLIKSEEERQFMMKWIFGGPRRPFCDFIFSLCIKNESRENINPRLHP